MKYAANIFTRLSSLAYRHQEAAVTVSSDTVSAQEVKTSRLVRMLLYGLVVLMLMTSVSLASYHTVSVSQNASRVAVFEVLTTHSDTWSIDYYHDAISVVVGGSKTYTFRVQNNSEVAVRTRLVATRESAAGTNPSVNPSGYFDLAPNAYRDVTVVVAGATGGNKVKVNAESTQID